MMLYAWYCVVLTVNNILLQSFAGENVRKNKNGHTAYMIQLSAFVSAEPKKKHTFFPDCTRKSTSTSQAALTRRNFWAGSSKQTTFVSVSDFSRPASYCDTLHMCTHTHRESTVYMYICSNHVAAACNRLCASTPFYRAIKQIKQSSSCLILVLVIRRSRDRPLEV